MSLNGLSLLEFCQPPAGYRTVAALATTYSADLVACLALLIAMDGNANDRLRYSRIEAFRALERLRDKVCILAQQNRVECDYEMSGNIGTRVFALFDTILHTVPFDGRKRSFHPKFLIARQQSQGNSDRYILAVGSRNLTNSSAWDFGVGLVGYARSSPPGGTRKLEGLDQFITELKRLLRKPALGIGLGTLNTIDWELPSELKNIRFHFHAGEKLRFNETQLANLPKRGRVLLISPFLTPTLVTSIAAHFAKANELRLVSGKSYLDQIAASKARSCFKGAGGTIKAYSMLLASDDARPGSSDDEESEQIDDQRGLHAKLFSVTTNTSVSAIIGSANLTARAWHGANWETFFTLQGSKEVIDELWNWCDRQAQPYRLPAPMEVKEPATDPIDDLRNELAELELLLIDFDGMPSRLKSATLGQVIGNHDCTLEIARFTEPNMWQPWRASDEETELPACDPSERTAFVLMRAKKGANSATWLQTVKVQPPITQDRDRQAFVRILGFDNFLQYLRGLTDDIEPETDDSDENGSDNKKAARHFKGQELLRLEDMLRKLVSDPNSLKEVGEAIALYSGLFAQNNTNTAEKIQLGELVSMWKAISTGMRMA